MAATLALLYRRHTPDFQQDFWRRAIDFERIGIKWYAVILLTVPALTALGALADKLLGGGGLQMEAAERFVQQPWSFLPFGVFTLVFGPLPEELAWRGYALDGLQMQWKALTASIVLGAAWTVWHLPLFFIEGSYQHGLGLPVAGQRMSRDRTFFGSYSAYQYPVPRQMGHGRPPRVTP